MQTTKRSRKSKEAKAKAKEKSIERRRDMDQQIEGLICKIGDLTDEAKASETFQQWLKVKAKFHRYSLNNVILILTQYPEATRINSFKRWKELGRYVKKGEKAIRILAPSVRKRKNEEGEEEERIAYFVDVPVFDISQTEGDDLPEIVWLSDGNDNGLVQKLEAFAKKKGIEVNYVPNSKLPLNAKGVSKGKAVDILETLQGAKRAAVLAHEIAHELLHKELSPFHDKSEKEIEAEGTAFVVLSAFGIEDNKSAFYLASWEGDSKKVKASLEKISRASKEILEFLED